MTVKAALAALTAIGLVAACEPIPSGGCQPQVSAQGRTIVACTPDGRPIVVDPQPVVTAPPAPVPVQTQVLPGTASVPFGVAPVMTGATGEPLPPVPTTLTPVPAPTQTPTTAPGPAPVVTPAPVQPSGDPNALPTTIAPPPASVTETFPVQ